MKKVTMFLMLLLSMNLLAQKGWMDGTFPTTMVIAKAAENPLIKGDTVFSAFKIGDAYYVSWVHNYANKNLILKGFRDENLSNSLEVSTDTIDNAVIPGFSETIPIKTGFAPKETVYWILKRSGVTTLLDVSKTYKDTWYTYIKLATTNTAVQVFDNPYFSLNPVWPENNTVKLTTPKAGKKYNISSIQIDRMEQIKYINNLVWIAQCSSKVEQNRSGVYITFTQIDIDAGFITIKLSATAFKNSTSTAAENSKLYTFYW